MANKRLWKRSWAWDSILVEAASNNVVRFDIPTQMYVKFQSVVRCYIMFTGKHLPVFRSLALMVEALCFSEILVTIYSYHSSWCITTE
jgi:hypothetical protein